jgi:hypothetical protein
MVLCGHGVAHLQAAQLTRHSMTGTCPFAFKCPGRRQREMLQSRLRRLSEVVDAIAIPVRTGKAEIGAGTRIEHEGLFGVRGAFIGEELQTHGEMGRARGDLTQHRRRSPPLAQTLSAVLKS